MSKQVKPKQPEPKRGAGRPREVQGETRVRTFRITDAEWDALRDYLGKLRAGEVATHKRKNATS